MKAGKDMAAGARRRKGDGGQPAKAADSCRPPGRVELAILASLLTIGLAVRAAYLVEITRLPDFNRPAVDALFHDYWARGLAFGQWEPPQGLADPEVRQSPYFRPPGFPYFLAGVYALTGGSYLAPRIVQMLLGLAAAAMIWAAARRRLGPTGGLAAGGLMALYWPTIYWEGELQAAALTVFLLAAATWMLDRWSARLRGRWLAAAGAALGAAALFRPNVLPLVFVAAGWAAWVAWRRGRAGAIPRLLALSLLPAAAVIAPVTARNVAVSGRFVPISANAGINLYIGNNPDATGGVSERLEGLGDFGTCFDYPALARTLQQKLGRRMDHTAISEWFADEAWAFIRAHPGRALALAWKKLLLLAGPVEVGHNKEVALDRAASKVLRCDPIGWPVLLALAAVGWGASVIGRIRRRPDAEGASRPAELIVLTAAGTIALTLTVIPFFVAGRYRAPMAPLLAVSAGLAAAAMGRAFRQDRLRGLALAMICLAAILLAGQVPQPYRPMRQKWLYDRGTCHLLSGEPDPAAEYFRLSLAADPDYLPSRYNLGQALMQQGRLPAAIVEWDRIVRDRPDEARARTNLGLALVRTGQAAEGHRHLEAVVRLRPDSAAAHVNLALALAAMGRRAEAMAECRKALAIDENDAPAHANLGRGLLAEGKAGEAIEHLEAAARLVPANAAYWAEAAVANQIAGRWRRAVELYNHVLHRRPDSQQALNNLAWLLATCPEPAVRDGEAALKLAERAAELTEYRSGATLDTLAAAYAETGRFEKAVETVRRAMALPDAATAADWDARLSNYRAGRPWRSEAGGGDPPGDERKAP